MDDEVFARLFATQILEDAGFATIEADSSTEALDILDRESRVSVMITDVCMPGDRDGLVLAKKVADCFPGVAVLVVSDKARPAFTDLPPGSRFLAKPYTAHELARIVRQVTSRSEDEILSAAETSTREPSGDLPENLESGTMFPIQGWLG